MYALAQPSAVALMSYCCDTGVGITGADFFAHLPFSRWIVAPHRRLGVNARYLSTRCVVLPQELEPDSLYRSLEGIDTLLCIERGYYPNVFRLAKSMGVRTVLMPNAEWFDALNPDFRSVDSFIAPTIACFELLTAAGFISNVTYIPHVIDTERFLFRVRKDARLFLHCSGSGGYKGRKGTDIVLEAAARCSHVPFLIRSQERQRVCLDNVTMLGAISDPALLYLDGDVSIQPSRWEGVGRQILEAMSCGLPTFVPDAPPMNEHQTNKLFCIKSHRKEISLSGHSWSSWEMDLECLVSAIWRVKDTPIEDWSIAARASMEDRSWAAQVDAYKRVLGMS